MSGEKKDFYLYIDGKPVKVTEEVHREYKRAEEKERYFMKRLKKGKFVFEPDGRDVTYVQSREASYEHLLEKNWDFPASGEPVDDAALKACLLEKLDEALKSLTDEEMELIQELFYLEKSEREACVALDMAKTTLHRKKAVILEKLRRLMEN